MERISCLFRGRGVLSLRRVRIAPRACSLCFGLGLCILRPSSSCSTHQASSRASCSAWASALRGASSGAGFSAAFPPPLDAEAPFRLLFFFFCFFKTASLSPPTGCALEAASLHAGCPEQRQAGWDPTAGGLGAPGSGRRSRGLRGARAGPGSAAAGVSRAGCPGAWRKGGQQEGHGGLPAAGGPATRASLRRRSPPCAAAAAGSDAEPGSEAVSAPPETRPLGAAFRGAGRPRGGDAGTGAPRGGRPPEGRTAPGPGPRAPEAPLPGEREAGEDTGGDAALRTAAEGRRPRGGRCSCTSASGPWNLGGSVHVTVRRFRIVKMLVFLKLSLRINLKSQQNSRHF